MRFKNKKAKLILCIVTAIAILIQTPALIHAADDYPARYKNAALDALADEWNFFNREGTSFAAWCLNSRNGVPFHNYYGGMLWGHAKNWGNTARALGYAVDMNPSKGSIWWSTAGTYGQVAWVSAVEGGKVRIEAYNYDGNGTYYERLLDIGSASGYIHIKDLPAPAPPAPVEHGSEISGGTQTIPDGDYHILTKTDTNQCLDIQGSSKENKANVQIWKNLDNEVQVFTVRYMGNGFYEIMNKNSGKYLDVEGHSTANQTNVCQWERTNTYNQHWVIRETDDGFSYTIQSRISGYNLDMADGNTANGTNVQVYKAHGGPAQRWIFIPWGNSIGKTLPEGEYRIVPRAAAAKVLGADGEGALPAGNVRLESARNDSSQVYKVIYLGNGYYNIANKNSGLMLDVAGAGLPKGTNVQLWKTNGSSAQQWILKKNGNYFNIISRYSGMYVDLSDGKTADHTNIQLWTGNGDAAQDWSFVKWTNPITPSTPAEPAEPTAPSTPAAPSVPSQPDNPTAPSTPAQPTDPDTPDNPDDIFDPLSKYDIRVSPSKASIRTGKSFYIEILPAKDSVWEDISDEEWNEMCELSIDTIEFRSTNSLAASVNKRTGKVIGRKKGTAVIQTKITFAEGETAIYKTRVNVKRSVLNRN